MNIPSSTKTLSTCLMGAALVALGATGIQAQSLGERLELRPLTPQEIKDYSLTGAQRSGGLHTVGVGQPGYLEVLVNIDVPPSENVNVSWNLTNAPGGSTAMLEPSPLGTNVPPFKIVNRVGGEDPAKVAGRIMLRPDVPGQYTVVATISSVSGGSATLVQNITAANYMGRDTCALCHSGGVIAPDKWGWTATGHATAFQMALDGISTDHFNPNCISCHVVGFDTYTNAVNGGWDDVAAEVGWVFPPVATNGNFDAMPHKLQNVSNIQCENCHGAGSEHAIAALSDIELAKESITVNLSAGNCAQCHDSLSHHYKVAEWNKSGHANAPEETRSSCARCHTAQGFVNFTEGDPAVSVPYEVITCAACHTLHNADNPHQIRSVADVTLMDSSRPGGNTVVTNGGSGKLCMQCHISRRDAVTYVQAYHGHYGPHHGPQTDMLVGANAITYGQDIPSSSHYSAVEDACVTCHMQPVGSKEVGFTEVGGHTFMMHSEDGSIEMLGACRECHGEIESFDFARKDYDGNGIIDGVQTEVQGLMDQLGVLLPPYGSPEVIATSSWTPQEREAAYNYLFVEEDGSHGIHNLSYAVGILKASIADLTDDANNDKLADTWQMQHYGSISDPGAAPTAIGINGLPNWLSFSLGLNPNEANIVIPNGVVYANGKTLGGEFDTIYIFTAAEVAFETELGKSYQIQEVTELSGGWQNVGNPIPGTGNPYSYVTPTRDNVQQFFRVVITP